MRRLLLVLSVATTMVAMMIAVSAASAVAKSGCTHGDLEAFQHANPTNSHAYEQAIADCQLPPS